MILREQKVPDFDAWKRMRRDLWPDSSESDHEKEMKIIASGGSFGDELAWNVFVVEEAANLIGFAEVSLRNEFQHCIVGPVGYLEGWYVSLEYRNKGVGRILTNQAESWAKEKGCRFMVSDVEFDNEISLIAHQNLGYRIIEKDEEGYILLKNL